MHSTANASDLLCINASAVEAEEGTVSGRDYL